MAVKQKIALIGYGHWGQKVFRYLNENREFDLAWVHFRSLGNLSEKHIREKYGDNFTADIDRIWKDESIGSVYIATPVKTHFELTMAALEHNKHVLVEKPVTLSVAEARQINTLARTKNLKVLTNYIYTFSKSMEKAGQIIRSGEIGKVNAATMTIKQLGRFTDHDVYPVLASHCIAVLNTLFPRMDFIFERRDLVKTNRLVSTGLVLFHSKKENIKGCIEVSLNCPQRDKKMTFYGDKGTLIYDPFSRTPLVKYAYAIQEGLSDDVLVTTTDEYCYDEANNIARVIETFYDCLTTSREDNLDMSIEVTGILEELSSARNFSECLLVENA